MTGLIAFICFVIATVLFALVALEKASSLAWGFVFVAGGLALMCLSGAAVWVQSRSS